MGFTCESEVFALGSCLYEVMAGFKPYPELEHHEIESAYARGEFPDVASLNACSRIITKCWERKYERVADILDEVRAEVEGMGISL